MMIVVPIPSYCPNARSARPEKIEADASQWDGTSRSISLEVESLAKGVFTTKLNPTYDGLPECRYHFPKTYLNQAKATVDDWIVYYEPRRQDANASGRDGRQVYFATARVQRIVADPHRPDHYYAFVTDFLEFGHIVPFRQGGRYLEDALMKEDGSTNRGAFGRSVRLISENGINSFCKSDLLSQ